MVLSLRLDGLDDLRGVSDPRYLVITPATAFLRKAGAAMRQAAARQSPKGRTKKYSRSWVEEYGAGSPPAFVRVKNTDEPKATWIALGTRPHVIRPRSKRALFWPGAAHPVKSVFHPGTAPNDVAGRAAAEAQREIMGPIKAAWDADVKARWAKRGIAV